MHRHLSSIITITILVLASLLSYSQDSLTKQPHRVVFQLSSNDTTVYRSFVKQLHNLQRAMEGVQIEVVTHGPGVEFLFKNSIFSNSIERLKQKGISFFVCQNTLNEKKILPAELLAIVEIIPAGIAHVILRQSEGWSYIKVGF